MDDLSGSARNSVLGCLGGEQDLVMLLMLRRICLASCVDKLRASAWWAHLEGDMGTIGVSAGAGAFLSAWGRRE